MNALDTNILARHFVTDENDIQALEQKQRIKHIMLQPSFVPLSVSLEFYWVMKSVYDLPKATVINVFQELCNTRQITVEHSDHLLLACQYYAKGMDFADALHLMQANHCQRLFTFDKKFIKKSAPLNLAVPVVEPN